MARLIAPIFCWAGVAYQTRSFFNYRPLGQVSNLLEILDRHKVDEIALLARCDGGRIDDEVLRSLRSSRISTPVTYGGGIRSQADVVAALEAGADRVAVNSALFDAGLLDSIVAQIGSQGVIAMLPFQIGADGTASVFDSSARAFRPLSPDLCSRLRAHRLEVLLHDVRADGQGSGFEMRILEWFAQTQLILMGGCTALPNAGSAAINGLALENVLTWTELAPLHLRRTIDAIDKRGLFL